VGCVTEEFGKVPLAEFPRSWVNRQVTTAVREAMKGQPPEILEVNQAVLRDTECRQMMNLDLSSILMPQFVTLGVGRRSVRGGLSGIAFRH